MLSLDSFDEMGVALLPGVLSEATLERAREECDRLLDGANTRGGSRNALQQSPWLRSLAAEKTLASPAEGVLGLGSRPVKLTVFDKTARANWFVPWHQDLTITVRDRREVPGFGPWSVKGGQHHVQPPSEVLASIVAIRVHLDDTPSTNGALRVVPGSHRFGRLTDDQVEGLAAAEPLVCELRAGDAMLMSPLLLHASSRSETPARRRVLHYEFSASQLPGGLLWWS